MSLVVPNTAEILMLKYIVNAAATDGTEPGPSGGNRILRLYSNNITPSNTTVLGGITETTAAGYTPITLTGSSWTISTSAGVTTASYAQQTFSFTTGVSIYGYYVTTQGGSPQLLWAERFTASPYVLPSGGGEIEISLRVTLD
jgi:hypothetical protein